MAHPNRPTYPGSSDPGTNSEGHGPRSPPEARRPARVPRTQVCNLDAADHADGPENPPEARIPARNPRTHRNNPGATDHAVQPKRLVPSTSNEKANMQGSSDPGTNSESQGPGSPPEARRPARIPRTQVCNPDAADHADGPENPPEARIPARNSRTQRYNPGATDHAVQPKRLVPSPSNENANMHPTIGPRGRLAHDSIAGCTLPGICIWRARHDTQRMHLHRQAHDNHEKCSTTMQTHQLYAHRKSALGPRDRKATRWLSRSRTKAEQTSHHCP